MSGTSNITANCGDGAKLGKLGMISKSEPAIRVSKLGKGMGAGQFTFSQDVGHNDF
jgi:hypothetical protein